MSAVMRWATRIFSGWLSEGGPPAAAGLPDLALRWAACALWSEAWARWAGTCDGWYAPGSPFEVPVARGWSRDTRRLRGRAEISAMSRPANLTWRASARRRLPWQEEHSVLSMN